MIDKKTLDLYKFIKSNSGYIVGESSKGALAMAKRLQVPLTLDFKITWEYDEYYSLDDLGDYQSKKSFALQLDNGQLEVLNLTVECEDYSEHLGLITVNPQSNDTENFKRMFELELIDQLYDQLKKGV